MAVIVIVNIKALALFTGVLARYLWIHVIKLYSVSYHDLYL